MRRKENEIANFSGTLDIPFSMVCGASIFLLAIAPVNGAFPVCSISIFGNMYSYLTVDLIILIVKARLMD